MTSRWTAADIPDQTGRTVLITGANSGLGLRSAEALAAKDARVLMACRNETKATAALEQVRAVATSVEPEIIRLDLADLASVRAGADRVGGLVDRLDVLMNNAGVMALPLGRTADGFEMQFGTNHLGHFALTGLLLPALRRAEAPRVVTTSSAAHRAGAMRWEDLNWNRAITGSGWPTGSRSSRTCCSCSSSTGGPGTRAPTSCRWPPIPATPAPTSRRPVLSRAATS